MTGYWARVHRQAAVDAFRPLGIDSIERATSRAIIGIIAIGFIAYLAGLASGQAKLLTAIAGIAGLFLVFPLVYIYTLFFVPPRLAAESEKEKAELSDRIAELTKECESLKNIGPDLEGTITSIIWVERASKTPMFIR